MDFDQAVKYLDKLVSYEKLGFVKYGEEVFDLQRIRDCLSDSGRDLSAIKFIHVAGSKGKGAVCEIIANYLQNAGFKVGLYTSPHIKSVTERIWFDGKFISDDKFSLLVEEVKEVALRHKLTYFEFLTVMALIFFADNKADFAVLEVGLGGRLDATNIIDPVITALTLIEGEHTEVFGERIEDILKEKMGIKKPGAPMIIGRQNQEAEDILKSDQGLIFLGGKPENSFKDAEDLASLVLKNLLKDFDAEILNSVSNKSILPGRLDVRQVNGKSVVFDMAHTENSIANLLDFLRKAFPGKKLFFLISIMNGKNAPVIVDLIEKVAEKIVFTQSHPTRSIPADELAGLTGLMFPETEKDCKKAYLKLLDQINENQVLIVTGSHFLVGELLS